MDHLSKPQKLIYDMEKYAGGSINVICGVMLTEQEKTVPAMEAAVNEIFRLNDALRLRITENGEEAAQFVADYAPQKVEALRFESKTEFDRFADEYAKIPFDFHGPLCEIKIILLPEKSGILVKFHHIVGDAWTIALIGTQFNTLIGGEQPKAYSYLEYLDSEEAYWQSPRCEKDRAFFLEQFQRCREVTYLSEKQSSSFSAKRKTFVLAGDEARKVSEYVSKAAASPFALFLTALAVYISRVKQNAEKFYIGTAVLNRSGVLEKNTMGMFVNTVPLLMELDHEKTFAENLSEVKTVAVSALRHQKFNYGDTLSAIRREYGFTEKLYDVMLSYQNAAIAGAKEESTWYHSGAQSESLEIHIDDRDSENIFRIHFDYQTEKFTEAEIERMYGQFLTLLFDAVEHEDKKLSELELLPPEERQKLLFDFNATAMDYPKEKTVHRLFEEQAERTPDKTAVIACDRTLTYRELNEEANRIAHGLLEKGVQPGDIVAFALPRNSHLIPVMFGILKAGAAYLPIDSDYPQERIDFMLRDGRAAYFITEENLLGLLENGNTGNPDLSISSESPCYCIYTSGTTGNPKGALVLHRGVVNFCTENAQNNLQRYIARYCTTVLACGAIVFDISSFEIVLSLLLGKTVALADEQALYNTQSLAKWIDQHEVDCIHCTPTKLRAYLENTAFSTALSQVKCIMMGGEQLTEEVRSCIEKHTAAKIFNGYGPTETTMGVCFGESGVAIGHPIANTQIYIVDKYLNPVPLGVTGELCIAGDGVGAGYLNRPELTAEKFIDNPFGKGKLYKTGDLAYWREDGNIVYVGRNDFQVKIRGLRIELGEIENALQGVEGISQAVVVVRKDETGRQLICAFYTGREQDGKTLRSAIGQKLPKYMLPHVFTHLTEMPLTPSGKVNRKALPEMDLHAVDTTAEYIAPQTEQEKILVSAVESILNCDKVSVLDNFFDLGGDSLKVIELLASLEKQGYRTDTKTIFDSDTLQSLAELLVPAEAEEEEILDFSGELPATAAQMRVYTAQSMQENSTAYNVPFVFRVDRVDVGRLQAAIDKMISRYEILRTHFENRDGTILQIVDDTAVCTVEQLASDDISAFVRFFDLSRSPLLRVGVFENTVMVDMHHIITDGGSMPVFFRELNELYMGRALLESPVQYHRFAAQKQNLEEAENYWLSVYSDDIPVLEINTDFPRGNKQSFEGAAIYETLPAELHNQITAKCKALGITPYAFYMGAFFVLLSKFSGNEDIVVGTPASGRSGKFLNTLGMFVNTLALREKPEGEKEVLVFLREIREATVQALEHQDYPYGDLVKKLNIQTPGRNPLFDVMFAYQSEEMTKVVFGDKPAEILSIPVTTSKYDFTFNILPRENDVVLMAEYCTGLFRESTIQRFIESYRQILTTMLHENTVLKDIAAVSPAEKQKLLYDFNATAMDYPKEKTVHQLFEEQAAKTPDKTAVIACDRTLTYRELNEEANRIAHGLLEQGVQPGDIVAFALPRNSHLIPAMFGILKAGAAYLPIDPDYPQDRIDFMLRDSRAAYFITEKNLLGLLKNGNIENSALSLSSESLCYCIYTSGTTGNPKGVTITHKSVNNFIVPCDESVFQKTLTERCQTVVSCNSVTFDITLQEVFLPLINGLDVFLLSDNQIYNIQTAVKSLSGEKYGLIITPTKLEIYMENETFRKQLLPRITVIMSGAELFPASLFDRVREYGPAVLFNGYGPTETTCGVIYSHIISSDDITIGHPIANTQIYIVDKYLNPVPLGVTGELCIAGDGVGAGYLNRPELTAEKFIDNPFGEGKLYKTGDLAYWREDGNIVYVGRNDFQVKIRGLRIELGEIENALQGVNGISQAVVIVRKDETGRQLICAFYTGREQDGKTLRSAIGQKLPKYMLPHVFTHLTEMPLTPSGKANRKALPEIDLHAVDTTAEYVAPQTEQEKILASAVESILNCDKVSVLDNFFDLGGDSLKAIELLARLEKQGYRTDTKTIFDSDTLQSLAELLVPAEAEEEETLDFSGKLPATAAQMRVYTAQSMQENSTAYNVPFVFRVDRVDVGRLQAAIDKMISRYEILRTHFENRDGTIFQVVGDRAERRVELLNSDDISAFVRPFDFSQSPLLRVGVFENTVMVDMHHIITDGGSMPVFFRELNEFYMGREVNEGPVQYHRFAAQKQNLEEAENYWLSVYSDDIPVLEINTDFPRGNKQSFEGAAIYETLPAELHNQITAKCKALGITPYAFYMGAFFVLLSKFSGNEDIVVGTPASGRSGKFLNTLGMFVNTLALRGKPEGEKNVADFLREVRNSSADALNYQNYPYGDLVKKLEIHTENRNPLFDVMFAYQSEEMTEVVFGEKPAELLPIPVTTSKYDFTFNVLPRENDVVLMAEYCTGLFKETALRRLISGYKLLLSQMLDSEMPLSTLSAIPEKELHTLLYDFNATAGDYPKEKTVHRLFEEQAERTPDKTAVIACDRTLTYRELNEEANRIAHGLLEKGVQPGDIVAFALPRNSHLISTMFGILKAGAAYLPVDPDYPEERISYMLQDSGARLFVTEKELPILLQSRNAKNPYIYPSNLDKYCVIYTSGSTGRPKGCILLHQGVCNFCVNSNVMAYFEKVHLTPVSISLNNVTFDFFVAEIFVPLLHGNKAVLCSEDESVFPDAFWSLCEKHGVNLIQTTPTKYRIMLNSPKADYLKNVALLVTSGEPLTEELVKELRKYTLADIFNPLGPSETTVWSPNGEKITSGNIHIGKPLANTQIYIVDKYLNPVPLGVTGELCIAGDGVGAGYLNRPELTAEKFIDNPFGEGKLYKTGDLAYWREDGNIAYVGRNDFQVKIRGLRIELGEIENALQGVNGISQAVVVVRKDETGRQMICAFYTGREQDGKALRSAIGQKLPKYMLPHVFTHLEKMPLTPSGKVNRKALPEIDLHAVDTTAEYVAPVGEMEKHLAALMEQTLEYSPIGREDDFFDLGGDSLKAIGFVSKAHTEGIYFSLQNVFDHPTVRALREYIENGDKTGAAFSKADFAEIDRVLAKNAPDNLSIPPKQAVGNLLLTGATGFLGSHILAEFLEHDRRDVYCLVRGENKEESKKRFIERLRFYFGEKYAGLVGGRIKVICGDLQKEKFGLSEPEYQKLQHDVQTVIHSAATVKHYGSYRYFYEANVETTLRLIDFCKSGNARLIHISTLSVSGNSNADSFDGYISETEKHFSESDLFIGQPLDNVYARSKFEAEKAVLTAMTEGLQANIMRMGNLTNRASDGEFQINYETNAAAKRIKGALELGIIPDYLVTDEMYVEFTPVDKAAQAVMTIVRHFSTEQTVFHINSTKVVYMAEFMSYFTELGYPLRKVPGRKFTEALRRTAKEAGMEHIFETFINDLDQDDKLNYDSNIRIENQFTEKYLNALGFHWGEIGLEYLRKYVKYFEEIGWMNKI